MATRAASLPQNAFSITALHNVVDYVEISMTQ